ncbi:hypothetical protein [Hymenobacter sp. 102]|uniref:hypothetical protein n=1 Tax=Hymenobacter sp. 102 TaxID=3403152 RepID=UPI003CE6A742
MSRTEVMLATGHPTEKSFIRYLGTYEHELVASFRRVAKLAAKTGGGKTPNAAYRCLTPKMKTPC